MISNRYAEYIDSLGFDMQQVSEPTNLSMSDEERQERKYREINQMLDVSKYFEPIIQYY